MADITKNSKKFYRGCALNVEDVFPKEFPKNNPPKSDYYVIPPGLEAQWTANAILDDDNTLLEYRHLLKRPKDKIT